MRVWQNLKAYSFDDVLLVPQRSDIASRSEVDISVRLDRSTRLPLPILSANMDTVTGPEMAKAMFDAGGMGILHRFTDWYEQKNWIIDINDDRPRHFGMSIGVRQPLEEEALRYYPKVLAIDVAHGDHAAVVQRVKDMKWHQRKKEFFPLIMAGNVATYEGARSLAEAGADLIKVGVGSGSACTTRIETGHGMPQLTAIAEAKRAVEGKNPPLIVADGGIRCAGDIVKALAAGADLVMLGGMLAGTNETPGEIVFRANVGASKVFRGSASFGAKLDAGMETKHIEGRSTYVPLKGSVKTILKNLEEGIRSGLSYSGARTIKELQRTAAFVEAGSARNVG